MPSRNCRGGSSRIAHDVDVDSARWMWRVHGGSGEESSGCARRALVQVLSIHEAGAYAATTDGWDRCTAILRRRRRCVREYDRATSARYRREIGSHCCRRLCGLFCMDVLLKAFSRQPSSVRFRGNALSHGEAVRARTQYIRRSSRIPAKRPCAPEPPSFVGGEGEDLFVRG